VARRDLLTQLGWQQDSAHPQLRVVSATDMSGQLPAILVGDGFHSRPTEILPVWTFWETSPLLGALNLDLAERLAMTPLRALPENFIPVLTGEGGQYWIAQRNSPPAALIPGLPIAGDGAAARFSTVLFLNAARWILEKRQEDALFRLTSPQEPEPKGNLLALHPGEGNTGRAPASAGILDFQGRAGSAGRAGGAGGRRLPGSRDRSLVPFFLFAALSVFLLERWYSFFGGPRWN
jgi:hypothetical protein